MSLVNSGALITLLHMSHYTLNIPPLFENRMCWCKMGTGIQRFRALLA